MEKVNRRLLLILFKNGGVTLGKMISGAIFILASVIIFVSRYLVTAVISNGQNGDRQNFYEIMNQYSFSSTFLTLSIILAIIGVSLVGWGVLKKEA